MIRAAVLFCLIGTAAAACGPDTDCPVADGRAYRIDLPEGDPQGAILFAHGYRGSAAGTMRNAGLRSLATDRGLAFVALGSADDDWDLPNAPGMGPAEDGTSEIAYLEAVAADVGARFGVPGDRLMMAGFSAGGMFVWTAACARPDLFGGFVAIAGTFWRAPPEACATPAASLLHIHGTSDTTVPLDGRRIADTRQGRVDEALAMYRDHGGFGVAVETDPTDGLECRRSTNAAGRSLTFCLHSGGHSFRNGYVALGWDLLLGPD